MVLAEFSSVSPRIALAAWYTVADMSSRSLSYMARIFGATAKRIKREEAEELIQDMQKKLDTFSLPPENISPVMHAAQTFMQVTAEREDDFVELRSEWCRGLFERCEESLSELLFHMDNQAGVVRRLFTLGVVIQYSPKMIVLIVESLVASEHIQSQLLHNKSLNGKSGSILNKMAAIPLSIQTIAVGTLGKIFLLEEDIAKTSVPSLVREMSVNRDPQVRNNIMMTLSDLCIRYTSVVDRHIGTLSLSLKDTAVVVRKQTLTLLTNLLKEDFLRWRGVLYRFVSTLLDEDEEIRKFAEFCLIHVLLVRFPSMFFHHFLECLYFFNGVKHPSWESKKLAGDQSSANAQLFSLKVSFPKELLYDCLVCLGSEEIKITLNKRHNQTEEGEEEPPVQATVEAAKNKVVSQVLKRATIDRIVPSILSLKGILERKKSSLMRPLLLCLRELMKDYRPEIEEVLGNRQQVLEIDFELRNLERRMAEDPADNNPPPPEGDAPPPPAQPVRAAEADTAEEANNGEEPMEERAGIPAAHTDGEAAGQQADTPASPLDVQEEVVFLPRMESRWTRRLLSGRWRTLWSVGRRGRGVRTDNKEEADVGKKTPRRRPAVSVLNENTKDPVPARAISTPAHESRLLSELTFQPGK